MTIVISSCAFLGTMIPAVNFQALAWRPGLQDMSTITVQLPTTLACKLAQYAPDEPI